MIATRKPSVRIRTGRIIAIAEGVLWATEGQHVRGRVMKPVYMACVMVRRIISASVNWGGPERTVASIVGVTITRRAWTRWESVTDVRSGQRASFVSGVNREASETLRPRRAVDRVIVTDMETRRWVTVMGEPESASARIIPKECDANSVTLSSTATQWMEDIVTSSVKREEC